MIDEKDVEVIPQEEMESLKGGKWVYVEELGKYVWIPDVRQYIHVERNYCAQ